MSEKDVLVKTGVAAKLLFVTNQTITNWADKGYLKKYKQLSNRYLVSMAEIMQIKENMMKEAGVQK